MSQSFFSSTFGGHRGQSTADPTTSLSEATKCVLLLPYCCNQTTYLSVTLEVFESSINMAAMIGNDILDIGSRKNRRQREDPFGAPSFAFGAPGQFDLPNVADVSS